MTDDRPKIHEADLSPPADTERTIPPSAPWSDSSKERDPGSEPARTKTAVAPDSPEGSVEFSQVQDRKAASHPRRRPAPAQEIDPKNPPVQLRSGEPQREGSENNTTLQSMMRPDLLGYPIYDPRRFASIERELSEASAALRFLEKRLNRLEKDSRIALFLAGFALLVAALSLAL